MKRILLFGLKALIVCFLLGKSHAFAQGPVIRTDESFYDLGIRGNNNVNLPLRVYNNGSEELNIRFSSFSDELTNKVLDENFSDGSHSDWQPSQNNYIRIHPDTPPQGNVIRMDGQFGSIQRAIAPNVANYLGFKVKLSSIDSQNINYFAAKERGNLTKVLAKVIFSGSSVYLQNYSTAIRQVVADEWYQVEFRNISYETGTFDFYLNDELVVNDASFTSPTISSINFIEIGNEINSRSVYCDDFLIADRNSFIGTTTETGTVLPGGYFDTFFTVSSANLTEGKHNSNIILESNDPLKPAMSLPVELTVYGADSYCEANATTNAMGISSFTINGQSYYSGKSNYSFIDDYNITLIRENAYEITVHCTETWFQQIRVYADWNHDNNFDDDKEGMYLAHQGGNIYSGTLIIPYDAQTGTTRLRVRQSLYDYGAACGTTTYGEIEDYLINVSASPYCSVSVDENTVGIERVRFIGIDNSSGNTAYSDFTEQLTTTQLGPVGPVGSQPLIAPFELTVTSTHETNQQIKAWIDWNENNVFEDGSEEVLLTNGTEYGKEFSAIVNVPYVVYPGGGYYYYQGIKKVRIRLTLNDEPVACGLTDNGETEDYSLRVEYNPPYSPSGQSGPMSIEQQAKETEISVYPIPCKDDLTISLKQPLETASYCLFDQNGRTVIKSIKTGLSKEEHINVSELPKGVYNLRIISDDGLINKKIVVE